MASSLSSLSSLSEANSVVSLSKPAARIYDNIIDQPAGRALSLTAVGAISITNNHFNSELSGVDFLEQFIGAVFILNVGGLNQTPTPQSNPSTRATIAASNFTRNPGSDQHLPNGNILFNSNQSRLGFSNSSLTCQLIATADDLGFNSNQSDALGKGLSVDFGTLLINTFLIGLTLRASDSRFKELMVSQTSVKVSLWTSSTLMNNTNHNQGNHCIFAFNNDTPSIPVIQVGNQVLEETKCRRFFGQSNPSPQ